MCLGSAATHPQLPHAAVRALQAALDEGTLRTLALVVPCGARGPLVPDFVGRLSEDDDMPWRQDEDPDEVVDRIFSADDSATDDLVRDDEEAIEAHLALATSLLRAASPRPRRAHVPYRDETPIGSAIGSPIGSGGRNSGGAEASGSR